MFLALVLGVDEDVIEIYYYENVELFYQNLIGIILEYDRHVSQSKRHDLVIEVAIVDLKGGLPFVTFSNSYLIIGISQVELGETPSLA